MQPLTCMQATHCGCHLYGYAAFPQTADSRPRFIINFNLGTIVIIIRYHGD